jgi:predicted metal-dependent phosphoesterase TrpH
MLAVDLHCHSTVSDGLLSPAEVVAKAAARGCQLLALTDHDDTRGLALARQEAEALGVKFINGVEISVSWGKHTLHVLGLNIDPENSVLQAGLTHLRIGRASRAELMAQSLAKVGIFNTLAGARQYAQNPEMITRTHFARHLMATLPLRNMAAVFKRFMVRGKPGFVKHEWAPLHEVINWIRGAGGVAVLAHPGRYDMGSTTMRVLLTEFKRLGGEAIEVVSGAHSAQHNITFARYAQEFALMASLGTDYHAPGEGGREPGLMPDLPIGCQPIWQMWYSNPSFYIQK